MNTKVITAKWIGPELQHEGTDSKGNTIKMGGDYTPPSDLVLIGFAGCMGMDVRVVLNKKRLDVETIDVTVTGHQPEDYPKPYKLVEIKFDIKGKNIPPEAVERAIALSRDKYCVVGQTLQEPVQIKTSFEVIDSK
jgi:putative redox protein